MDFFGPWGLFSAEGGFRPHFAKDRPHGIIIGLELRDFQVLFGL
jgi:hypothetical protein